MYGSEALQCFEPLKKALKIIVKNHRAPVVIVSLVILSICHECKSCDQSKTLKMKQTSQSKLK